MVGSGEETDMSSSTIRYLKKKNDTNVTLVDNEIHTHLGEAAGDNLNAGQIKIGRIDCRRTS